MPTNESVADVLNHWSALSSILANEEVDSLVYPVVLAYVLKAMQAAKIRRAYHDDACYEINDKGELEVYACSELAYISLDD